MNRKRPVRAMAIGSLVCYCGRMKTVCQKDYIDRLIAAGLRVDDATVLVSDFMRELDWAGLEDYCAILERLRTMHNVAEVSQ